MRQQQNCNLADWSSEGKRKLLRLRPFDDQLRIEDAQSGWISDFDNSINHWPGAPFRADQLQPSWDEALSTSLESSTMLCQVSSVAYRRAHHSQEQTTFVCY